MCIDSAIGQFPGFFIPESKRDLPFLCVEIIKMLVPFLEHY